MHIDDYFDLTFDGNNIESLKINEVSIFNCSLIDLNDGRTYSGFILAKSPAGNRFTICDVDFQRSATDGKYQPRLIFRRTKNNLEDINPSENRDHVRLPFAVGADGYRNFWKMIFFEHC